MRVELQRNLLTDVPGIKFGVKADAFSNDDDSPIKGLSHLLLKNAFCFAEHSVNSWHQQPVMFPPAFHLTLSEGWITPLPHPYHVLLQARLWRSHSLLQMAQPPSPTAAPSSSPC